MNDEKEGGKLKWGLNSILLKDKYKKIIIIAGMIGILLIFVSGFFKNDSNIKKDCSSKISADQYTSQIENSLTDIVCNICGAGKCKVLVTAESGAETVYATEGKKNTELSEDKLNGETTKKQESDDSEVKYITIKESNGTEKALQVTEIQPTIKGVVVVCQGADDEDVKQRITQAVTTALNITSKRVCVIKST